jgi:prevent-host-death family protein
MIGGGGGGGCGVWATAARTVSVNPSKMRFMTAHLTAAVVPLLTRAAAIYGQMTISLLSWLQAMKTRVVSATEFKAKCLALLDEIEQRAEPITITRRGVPVAVLGPLKKTAWKSPKNILAGKGRIVGDIVNGDPDLWDVVRQK